MRVFNFYFKPPVKKKGVNWVVAFSETKGDSAAAPLLSSVLVFSDILSADTIIGEFDGCLFALRSVPQDEEKSSNRV